MPRITQYRRLTRSQGKDAMWETFALLQDRIKFLKRQIRREERSKEALEIELQNIRTEFSLYWQETERQVLFRENRDLTLRVFNLQSQVSNVAGLLSQMGLTVPVPLDRTFSSFDFM